MSDDITIVTTVDSLEVILRAAIDAFAEVMGIELPPPVEALRAAGRGAAEAINHLARTASFANETARDIAQIPTTEDARPEFGGAAPTPFGFNPPV